MTDSVTQVRVGVPGAPGSGVTAAEKATYVTLSGANVFTNTNNFKKNSTAAVTVEKEDGTDVLVVDTTNKEVEIQNGGKLRGFSDNNTTETFSIDTSTGAAQFDSSVTTGGHIIGDRMWWEIEIDGGGTAITTGTKRRILIPYSCTITADPVDGYIWRVTLDQSGSIGLDLWVDTYANYPPTNADRISGTVGSNNPRVSAATKNASGSTTNWTLSLTGGSYLFVDVNSITTATFATLGLYVVRT